MAFTLQQAKQYYSQYGNNAQPPSGMQFDDWVKQWFSNAVDAGDPNAVAAAGGADVEGGKQANQNSYGGQYADWHDAAPSSEWLGKRAPTPRELRRYANENPGGVMGEDYARFSDAHLAQWIKDKWDPQKGGFFSANGEQLGKPVDSDSSGVNLYGESAHGGGGGGGGGRGSYGGYNGGGYQTNGGAFQTNAPQFNYTPFTAPKPEDVLSDPSYQFRVEQGQKMLQGSAAAKGLTRTGGTLQDLVNYGQQAASDEYGNAYNRALSTWGAQYQGQKDAFAPQYGAWQTQYGGDLAKWQTMYGGDLQKYLQRENNIYGLLNPQMPSY
jgi:hypothetical protein